jgi:hypothetical protein
VNRRVNRSKTKKKSEPKANWLKGVGGSLKGTGAMGVFVSERTGERRLARSNSKEKLERGKAEA